MEGGFDGREGSRQEAKMAVRRLSLEKYTLELDVLTFVKGVRAIKGKDHCLVSFKAKQRNLLENATKGQLRIFYVKPFPNEQHCGLRATIHPAKFAMPTIPEFS